MGRVAKDAWVSAWRKPGATDEQMRDGARLAVEGLREAADAYVAGYREDPAHFYSGINALTLLDLASHLSGVVDDAALRTALEGGVRWAVRCALSRETTERKDFWARATLADLELLTSDAQRVEQAYSHAIAASEQDWFAVDSVHQQLKLLEPLGFRSANVQAGLRVVDRTLGGLAPPWRPEKTFLFSGHMIDAPQRETPRFPPERESAAAAAIAARLDELGAGSPDLALCEGACGGDLLFARAALDRGLHLELRLPFAEPEFLQRSVAFAGRKWVDRYFAVRDDPRTRVLFMPDELGPTPSKRDPYERTNLWQLYTALAWGADRVRFIALWNGAASGKRGGTDHMIDAVRKRSGRAYVIDSNALRGDAG